MPKSEDIPIVQVQNLDDVAQKLAIIVSRQKTGGPDNLVAEIKFMIADLPEFSNQTDIQKLQKNLNQALNLPMRKALSFLSIKRVQRRMSIQGDVATVTIRVETLE